VLLTLKESLSVYNRPVFSNQILRMFADFILVTHLPFDNFNDEHIDMTLLTVTRLAYVN
jgi:hypothetical protein